MYYGNFIIYLLLLILSYNYYISQSQIINSITSFQTCASIDSRIQNTGDVNPAIQLINCSSTSGELPKVTIFDFTTNANIGTPTVFHFNLSVVPSDINNPLPQSTDPTKCVAAFPHTQLCSVTTPAQIKIVNTKYALGYQLTKRTNTQIPYCYGSAVQYEQFSYLTQSCQPNGNLSDIDNSICLPIQITPEHSQAINAAFGLSSNQADNTINSCVNFLRAQRIPDIVTYLNGKISSIELGGELIKCQFSSVKKINSVYESFNNDDNVILYGNNHCVDLTNQCLLDSDPSNIETNSGQQLPCDDATIDIRLPTFMPNPSINGNTPNPIFADVLDWLSNTDPITGIKVTSGDPCQLINTESTPNNQVIESFSYICAGATCPANVDPRKFTYINVNGELVAIPSTFDYTINSIYGFGPYCYIYDIFPVPKAVAEVTMEITTFDTDGVTPLHVETLVIDNFQGANGVSSTPFKYGFAKITNIGSTSNVIGPALGPGSALIICPPTDQQNNPVFPNMQCLIPGVQCDGNHIVTDWGFNGGLLVNPWDTLVEQSKEQIPNRTRFYPHPYDYAKPGTSNGKNTSFTSLPQASNGVFWYYVPGDIMANQFNGGPNGIGMALNAGSNSQINNLACNIPSHQATPGIGTTMNGGLKTATPCQVSSAMNLNAGWYDGKTFPQDLIFTTGPTILQNATTTSAQFVPNNQFLPYPIYDPKNPNAWIGNAGLNSAIQMLFLSPTTSKNIEYNNDLQIQVVMDVVGTFVSYETTVSPAQIDYNQNQTVCNVSDLSANGTLAVEVTNLSQQSSTAPPNTTYTLNLDCFFDHTGIVVTDNDRVVTLAPGETSELLVFHLSATSGTLDQASLVCLATLYFSEIVVNAPIADQKNISCNIYAIPLFGSPDVILGLPTPGVNQSLPPPVNCTGTCPITCLIAYGNPWTNACFISIVVFVVLFAVGTLALIGLIIYSHVYLRRQSREASKKINQNIDQQLGTLPPT